VKRSPLVATLFILFASAVCLQAGTITDVVQVYGTSMPWVTTDVSACGLGSSPINSSFLYGLQDGTCPTVESLTAFAPGGILTISYLASYVEEYMAPSGIDCRVKVPADVPALKLPSNFRHNLFLAVKEALNNVVRHSRAAEVRFEIAIEAAELKVNVADNGCGFDTAQVSGGNGLSNYDGRLAAIGGHCQICSRPGGGTAITFAIPLPPS